MKSYIEKVGGLGRLLSKCGTFSFDGKQSNILYLTEREEDYFNFKREKETLLSSVAPDCEDALFTKPRLDKMTPSDFAVNSKKKLESSSKLEIEDINGYLSGEVNEEDWCTDEEDGDDDFQCQMIGVDAKIQVETLKEIDVAEHEKLTALNQRLFSEIKTLRQENEKLNAEKKQISDELHKSQTEFYKNKLHIQVKDYKLKINYNRVCFPACFLGKPLRCTKSYPTLSCVFEEISINNL